MPNGNTNNQPSEFNEKQVKILTELNRRLDEGAEFDEKQIKVLRELNRRYDLTQEQPTFLGASKKVLTEGGMATSPTGQAILRALRLDPAVVQMGFNALDYLARRLPGAIGGGLFGREGRDETVAQALERGREFGQTLEPETRRAIGAGLRAQSGQYGNIPGLTKKETKEIDIKTGEHVGTFLADPLLWGPTVIKGVRAAGKLPEYLRLLRAGKEAEAVDMLKALPAPGIPAEGVPVSRIKAKGALPAGARFKTTPEGATIPVSEGERAAQKAGRLERQISEAGQAKAPQPTLYDVIQSEPKALPTGKTTAQFEVFPSGEILTAEQSAIAQLGQRGKGLKALPAGKEKASTITRPGFIGREGKQPVKFVALYKLPNSNDAIIMVDLPNGSTVGLNEASHIVSKAEGAKIYEAIRKSEFDNVMTENNAIIQMGEKPALPPTRGSEEIGAPLLSRKQIGAAKKRVAQSAKAGKEGESKITITGETPLEKLTAKVKAGEATGDEIKAAAKTAPEETEAALRKEFAAAKTTDEQGNLAQGIDIVTQEAGKKPKVPKGAPTGAQKATTELSGKDFGKGLIKAVREDIKGEKLGVVADPFRNVREFISKNQLKLTDDEIEKLTNFARKVARAEGVTADDQARMINDWIGKNLKIPVETPKATTTPIDTLTGSRPPRVSEEFSRERLGQPSKTTTPIEELTRQRATTSGEPPEIFNLGDVERLETPSINPAVNKKLVDAAEKLFTEKGITRVPKGEMRIFQQITDEIIKGNIQISDLGRFGITPQEFAQDIFAKAISSAGRELGRLGQLEKKLLQRARTDRAAAEVIDTIDGIRSNIKEYGWQQKWQRWEGFRKAMLVSQPATSIRNFVSQLQRIGVDVIDNAFDAGLQGLKAIAGKRTKQNALLSLNESIDSMKAGWDVLRQATYLGARPLRGLGIIKNKPLALERSKALTDKLLERFPRQERQLFQLFSSDIELGKLGNTAKKISEGVNWLNRGQENIFRRAIFFKKLNANLRARGLNLQRMIQNNEFGLITKKDVESAVKEALEFTFQESPKHGSATKSFVDMVNKTPLSIILPFPRFLANSAKFLFNHSPMGFLRLLKPSEISNTRKVAEAINGSMMTLAAYQFRNSDFAGEKWYEAKLPDGTIIDLRPFNPFAAYLFVADVVKRSQEGTLNQLTTKDVMMGVLSSNIRAGTGLALVDNLLDAVFVPGDEEATLNKIKRMGGTIAGEYVGGYSTPLQPIKDLVSEFDSSEKIIRDRRDMPFLAPTTERIPYASQAIGLPEAEIPTREAPLQREKPTLRQLTGITFKDVKNPAEKELDRLGFSFYEIMPSSGNAEADRLMAKHLGVLIEDRLSRHIASSAYQRKSTFQKAEDLRQELIELRAIAKRRATSENRKLFKELKYQRKPKRQRRALEELTQ